jgi:hypothetical protein
MMRKLPWAAAVWMWWAMNAKAQPDDVLRAKGYFEGTINYKFTVDGSWAEYIKEQNAIEFMSFSIKDGNFLVHLYGPDHRSEPRNTQIDEDFFLPDGGIRKPQIFPTTRVFLADSNRMYVVDVKNERVFKREIYDPPVGQIPEAKPIGDSLKICGYMCYGYKVVKNDETITYYVSPKVRANLGFYPLETTRATASFLTRGLNGCIPLKTIRTNKHRTISITATQVIPRKLDKAQFAIPPGFKIMGYDYRR